MDENTIKLKSITKAIACNFVINYGISQ